MKIQKIERGIHTIELYACNLKYEQVQKVMDWLAEEKQLQIVQRDFLNIDRHAKSDFLIASGVRIRIDQSHNKSNGIGLSRRLPTHPAVPSQKESLRGSAASDRGDTA